MKLYVLDLGKIVMKGANPVLDEPDAEAAIPIHAFLLDTPEGCILFDAGCHPKAMEGAWPPELCGNPYVTGPGENLPDQLARIGVDPGRITKVVLSHLHLDHAGGVHLFPQADVYVHQRELEQVMSDAATGTLDLFHVQCDVDSWKAAGTRWVPVPADAGETPLCPGVTILNLGPGHSFGMLGLSVELDCGTFLLVADAAYCREHFGPPAKLSGAVVDQEGYFAAMEYLRRYAAEHHAQILFGHDMEQFRTLKKPPEYYA